MISAPTNSVSTQKPVNLAQSDGAIHYYTDFLDSANANRVFKQLSVQLEWKQETLNIMGKEVIAPRLVCWHGDPGAVYRYSGVEHIPLPWNPVLKVIKLRIEQFSGDQFNCVLGNLYRDGNDSMGWHADKEKQLGINPVIASLSLGAKRLFKLRHNKSQQTVDIQLEHGSLLIMAGSLQHHWRHCLPKTRLCTTPRINLTFRFIDCD